jgi:hypothetical protein
VVGSSEMPATNPWPYRTPIRHWFERIERGVLEEKS